MNTFQFDQCFNDKKVIKACTDEGLANALRLPRDLHDKSDPELLGTLMKSANPLVTLDRALPAEHAASIPSANPGIVVVNYSRDVPRTITTREAARILRQFKDRLSNWNELSLQNSILEITEKSVEIWHIEASIRVHDGYLEFDNDNKWIDSFLLLLKQNARGRGEPPLGPTNGAS